MLKFECNEGATVAAVRQRREKIFRTRHQTDLHIPDFQHTRQWFWILTVRILPSP